MGLGAYLRAPTPRDSRSVPSDRAKCHSDRAVRPLRCSRRRPRRADHHRHPGSVGWRGPMHGGCRPKCMGFCSRRTRRYRFTVEIVGGTLPNGRNGHIGGGLGLKNYSHPMRLPHTYVYTILHLTLHPPQNVGTLRKVTHVYEQSSL